MKKIVVVGLTIIFLYTFIYDDVSVKLEKYYPQVLTLNSDNYNEVLFLEYYNRTGEELWLRIYDIYGILIDEQKVSGSTNEKSVDDRYKYEYVELQKIQDKFSPGIYIFTLVTKDKTVGKGIFVVSR